MEKINCPLSEKKTVLKNYINVKDHSNTQEEFTIVSCETTRFLFTNPRPFQKNISKYYEFQNYISHTNKKNDFTSKLYQLIRTYSINRKHTLISKLIKNKKILDIGSGTGEFLSYMKKNNYETYGVEIAKNARNLSIKNHKLNVKDSIFNLSEKNFDIITMWHVLEHIYDLDDYMRKIKNLLNDKGFLLVAVPNHKCYDQKFFGKYWAGWDVPLHLWHFDKNSMQKLSKLYGFEIFRIHPLYFDSFYVSLLSSKYKHGTYSYIQAFLIGLYSNLVAELKTGEYSSLIYILRKSN
ncbi:MAG: methyltransferase [Flavobacteriales bacterium]|nr:methyltransferase [Flavobacteriales bacterium]|tara:strand:+ start:2719 stop:3600 length:882 start_codon:yes stop_codon:yes gene_type:complete